MQGTLKWLIPVLAVGVGVPLIFADAASTSAELDRLDSPEQREAACRTRAEQLELADAPAMCSCIVRKAQQRGVTELYGAYDESRLQPIIDSCLQEKLWREG